MALPPCHMFCQFYVDTDRRELSCQMYQVPPPRPSADWTRPRAAGRAPSRTAAGQGGGGGRGRGGVGGYGGLAGEDDGEGGFEPTGGGRGGGARDLGVSARGGAARRGAVRRLFGAIWGWARRSRTPIQNPRRRFKPRHRLDTIPSDASAPAGGGGSARAIWGWACPSTSRATRCSRASSRACVTSPPATSSTSWATPTSTGAPPYRPPYLTTF